MAVDPPGNGRLTPYGLRRDLDSVERRITRLEEGDLLVEVRLIQRDVHAIKERLDEQAEAQRWLKRAFVGAILTIVSGVAITAITIVLSSGVA